MAYTVPEPVESFETWLLRRVAQAVEAGEVSVDLLTELQAEIEAAKEIPQAQSYANAVQDIAEIAGVPEDEARSALESIEAQPSVTQELLMRRFVEAWLEGQRRAYRAEQDAEEA